MIAVMIHTLAALLLAPLLVGVVNKTKAFFSGCQGAPVFQLYFDLWKLLQKSSPRSLNSTWIFDLAPLVSLVATAMATGLFVMARFPPCLAGLSPRLLTAVMLFLGFYLFGTARFVSVLSARDVASAFPDMGSAREVQFSALIEAVVFSILVWLVLGGSHASVPTALAALAAFIVLLAENCRVPFDDPETHLELTMIHEAMILDNSGPDLACILYASSLKLWAFSIFFLGILGLSPWFAPVVGVLVGAVESSMARYRFKDVPFALSVGLEIAVLAVVLEVLH